MPPRLSQAVVPIVVAVLVSACSEGEPERAAYLTLMGNDTLAIEWIEFSDGQVNAQALIRGSRTTFGEYHLAMTDAGELRAYTATVYAGDPAQGDVLRTEELVVEQAGRTLVIDQDGEERRSELSAEPGSVPFIDMLHWPFETALRWQARRGTMDQEIPTFTGRGMSFGLSQNEDGTWSLRHPSRGPSTMELDAEGRILALDGTGSTRAYDLRRIPYQQLDPTVMGSTFADRPLGELSGRGQVDDTVAGVHFTGHYGTPRRRGRTIFGELRPTECGGGPERTRPPTSPSTVTS